MSEFKSWYGIYSSFVRPNSRKNLSSLQRQEMRHINEATLQNWCIMFFLLIKKTARGNATRHINQTTLKKLSIMCF